MKNIYKKVAVEAALKSGFFIKGSIGKVRHVRYKGRTNIVTDVDRKSEEIIIKNIRRHFPSHSIMAEESTPQDRLSRYRWIIDPLDGTTNFAHSFPFFCVSIALEENGKIILGVVYDPVKEELFTAECGKGAYLNKRKICVSNTKRISEGFLATGFAYGIKDAEDSNIRHFENFLISAMAIRRAGSAALDLCYVGCGRFDGFWELDLHPWDSAAGGLIVKEAGGRITKFDGKRWTHYDKEILATNGSIHHQMIDILSNGKRFLG